MKDLKVATQSDPSSLTWIPINEILACSDRAFRDAYLKLIEQTVEAEDRSARSLALRAAANCELEKWHEARIDLTEILASDKVEALSLYQAGLLSLQVGDVEGYRTICDRVVKSSDNADDAHANHFSAWTCTLQSDAVEDFAPMIKLAEKAVAKDPMDQQYLTGLGAALMRAGEYRLAKAELSKALQLRHSDKISAAYIRYFQSITDHYLGNEDEAKEHLRLANEIANKELASAPPWNRKLTLQLLRKEAESY